MHYNYLLTEICEQLSTPQISPNNETHTNLFSYLLNCLKIVVIIVLLMLLLLLPMM